MVEAGGSAPRRGLVIVNTGDGKGKTTAALGLLLRARGYEMRVAMLQFLKSEDSRTGEALVASQAGIELARTGDGFTWASADLAETKRKALAAWAEAQALIRDGGYDVVVLDEFTYLLHYGWLETDAVVGWLRTNKPAALHLVITGRNAPPALVDYADLVTEMRSIKHPYTEGIPAQAGIEF